LTTQVSKFVSPRRTWIVYLFVLLGSIFRTVPRSVHFR
jgi:hypothetical protein